MTQRCLIISDDLTGGADTGAQFARCGLNTFLISFEKDLPLDFSKYTRQGALVINTDSRELSPEKAFQLISNSLKDYDPGLFPVIYKKIDSTLRGNIGSEIDALIKKTNRSLCFMTPSYPEQNRTVADGILMIKGKPLGSTEISRGTPLPLRESCVCKLLKLQSGNPVGWIGLNEVASGGKRLERRIEEEREKGNRIIVFDAVNRQDLMNVADVAFRMERMPLLVGSAGLAREIARKLSPLKLRSPQPSHGEARPGKHIFIISGSASSVTHQQLSRLQGKEVPEFILRQTWIDRSESISESERKEFSRRVSDSLSKRNVLLRTPPEFLPKDLAALPVRRSITETLASLALSALEESGIKVDDLALILTGGETAMSMIRLLQGEGVEIEDELLEGIMKGHLKGGKWDGLMVVTKAGAFGKDDTLKAIVEILEGE